jgi:hypothetical protein
MKDDFLFLLPEINNSSLKTQLKDKGFIGEDGEQRLMGLKDIDNIIIKHIQDDFKSMDDAIVEIFTTNHAKSGQTTPPLLSLGKITIGAIASKFK